MEEPQPVIVSVNDGQLRGQTKLDWQGRVYYSFQGIPYGKPPIGNLRFKAPQPAQPWSGVRDATKEGNANYCRDSFHAIIGAEDCLFLNVYTPDVPINETKLKPVMVWIHGGSFIHSSGNSDLYGPEFLMSGDVVLVTVSFRFGILGFASFEDPSLKIPGNAGLKDLVLALKWVQKNIDKFSGDHGNVTIFGESSGACSVHYLMLSSMANGLFHRAIAQSGSAISLWARGQATAPLVSKALGLKTTNEHEIVKYLIDLPVEELFKIQENMHISFKICDTRPFGPVVEPYVSEYCFMHEEPKLIMKSGRFNKVPLMIGYNSREGMLRLTLFKDAFGKMKWNGDFEDLVPYDLNVSRGTEESKCVAKKIKQFYYGNDIPSIENINSFYIMETDNFFLSVNNSVTYLSRNSSTPIYYYRVSIDTTLNTYKRYYDIKEPGTAHADELGYLFKNRFAPEIRPRSLEDITVRRFVKLWTTFARYGDPNPRKKDPLINIVWPPVKNQQLIYLDIGENLTIGVNPEAERVQFWNNIYKTHRIKSNL